MPLVSPVAAPWGTHDCRLDYYDNTRVILRRYGGKYLTINGQQCVIPEAGVLMTIPNISPHDAGLIYALRTGNTVTSIQYWQDVNAFSIGATGMPIVAGNPEATLVGLIWAQAGTIDGPRLVCSYWNRRWLVQYDTPTPATTSGSVIDLASTYMHWMGFAGDGYQVMMDGTCVKDVALSALGMDFMVDAVSVGSINVTFPAWVSMPFGMRGGSGVLATTGLHNTNMRGVSYGGGTAQWYANIGVRSPA